MKFLQNAALAALKRVQLFLDDNVSVLAGTLVNFYPPTMVNNDARSIVRGSSAPGERQTSDEASTSAWRWPGRHRSTSRRERSTTQYSGTATR
jgi:hypothetical protein